MMTTLKGNSIYLRPLEPEDLDYIYAIENNESLWELSSTQTPYSRYLIKQYLEHAHKDIFEVKQLRLLISDYDNNAIGLIDIFDFDPKNLKAGIGILISNELKRNKGIGFEALQLLIDYCFRHLNLHQLYCNISEDNEASIKLFTRHNFKIVGTKKDWCLSNGKFKNELFLQLINN